MIIARSPLRITLGGGGTDLPSYYLHHGGCLIAAAINHYVYVSVLRAFVPDMLIRYSDTERVERAEDIRHPLIREAALELKLQCKNLELTTMADVPAGTGLGSSGSFSTALLKALYRFSNRVIATHELAELASTLEIERLKEPVGKQDPYAAAFGGVNLYEFHPDQRVTVTPLAISAQTLVEFEQHVLMFCTGITRSAPLILKSQDDASKQGQSEMTDNLHFVKAMAWENKAYLESGDLPAFGRSLDTHWQHKKKRSKLMSTSEVDRLYTVATAKGGALGGKLIGAGGGGFLMFFAEDPLRLRKVMKEEEGLMELGYTFDFQGTHLLEPSTGIR